MVIKNMKVKKFNNVSHFTLLKINLQAWTGKFHPQ